MARDPAQFTNTDETKWIKMENDDFILLIKTLLSTAAPNI
jgi:hypothetical protein